MKLLVLLSLTLGADSWAGVRIGNAAHVMICWNRPNLVLLDFYEAETKHKLTLAKFPGLGAPQITDLVLDRLAERLPMLSARVREEFKFYSAPGNNTPRPGRFPELPHYADNLPSECGDPVVSAFQRDPIDADTSLYNYSKELRLRQDEPTFAGQTYHELAYRIGIGYGLDHPLGIRQQTGLVFSDQVLAAPDQTWINALANSMTDLYQVRGQWMPLFDEPLKTCNPLPRRENSCSSTVPSQATFTFDGAQSLTSVTYSRDRRIPLGDAERATLAIETSHLEVTQREDLHALKFTGRLVPVGQAAGGHAVAFRGRYVLTSRVLCGRFAKQRTVTCVPAADVFAPKAQVRVDM